MVVRQFEVGEFNVFAYLIGDETAGEGLFIDPADDTERLISEAEAFGLKITRVVNTHSHVDHVMGNRAMVDRTGAKIVIHEKEAMNLARPRDELLRMFKATLSPPADLLVKHGDTIRVGQIGLQVIHTPGHTQGGICLCLEGMVFTGDTLFVGSVGRTDFPGSSWEDMERSIRDRLYALPGSTVVYPGHHYGVTSTSTIQYERRTNPFVRG